MTNDSSDRTPSRRGVLQGLVGLGALGLTGLSTTAADDRLSGNTLQQSDRSGVLFSDEFNDGEYSDTWELQERPDDDRINETGGKLIHVSEMSYNSGARLKTSEIFPSEGIVRVKARMRTRTSDYWAYGFGIQSNQQDIKFREHKWEDYDRLVVSGVESHPPEYDSDYGENVGYDNTHSAKLAPATDDTGYMTYSITIDFDNEKIVSTSRDGDTFELNLDMQDLGDTYQVIVGHGRGHEVEYEYIRLESIGTLQQPELSAQNGLAYNDGHAYVTNNEQIIKFELESEEIVTRFDAPDGRPDGLAYGNGSLWFSDGAGPNYEGSVIELDPGSGEVRSQFSTFYDTTGLAFGGGSLWVGDVTGNNIYEYTPSGEELNSFDISGPTDSVGPRALAYFDGALWLGTNDTNELYKFSTDGTLQQSVGQRDTGYSGLATTDTELLGPAPDGSVTVLRTLREDDGDDDDDNRSDEEITACLGPTEVPLDGTTDVCITLQDFSSGFSGCELVFEFPDAVLPESVTTNDTFGLDSTDISGQTVTISVTDTDNAFSGTIDSLQIGCVTVRGAFEDTGTVTLESAQVDNEEGFQIGTVDFSGSCRDLSVVPGAQCPTVDGTETTDPDGDGLCEDLNGNDRQDFDDVVDLFDNISDSDVTDNPDAFDFNGNGRVDFDDVVELFNDT